MSARDDLKAARARANGNDPVAAADVIEVITASSVESVNVRWLWRGWVPAGMLSLLVGQPGCGKTTIAMLLAGEASRGMLNGDHIGDPGDVLIVSYEDHLNARLKPMVEAVDADLDRVHFLGHRDTGQVVDLTRHLPAIEHIVAQRDVRLLIIDPLVAGMPLGGVDTHRDQSVRAVLAPIAGLASLRDVAVLATMHLSKQATSALLGAGGSVGFAGAARSILAFGADPTDERGGHGPARVLAHAKCNVGRLQHSRRASVVEHVIDPFGKEVTTSRAVVGDETDVSADDLVRAAGGGTSRRTQAARFLRELLVGGKCRAEEVYRLAEDVDIPRNTLKRAKSDLGVISFQSWEEVAPGKQANVWWWELPEPEEGCG